MKCPVCKKLVNSDPTDPNHTNHTECQYVKKFRCMCGCGRYFSLNDLKVFGIKQGDKVKCRRKKLVCASCHIDANILIKSVKSYNYPDLFVKPVDTCIRRCFQCVENNRSEYLKEIHRLWIELELRREDAKLVKIQLDKHKGKYMVVKRMEAAFDLSNRYGGNYVLNRGDTAFLKRYRGMVIKYADYNHNIQNLQHKIIHFTHACDSDKMIKYIMTVLMAGNRIGLDKGITHSILMYAIQDNEDVTISDYYLNKYKRSEKG